MNAGPILLFDGVCNLCNRSVQFVIRHDRGKVFLFATLQGPFARKVLEGAGLTPVIPGATGSVVLLYHDKVYTRSTAVLKTLGLLGWPWKVALIFYIVPVAVRDRVYDWVARNRYRWFGQRDTCMVPTPDLRARFPDEWPAASVTD